jgi:hypothetical protein
MRKPLLLFATLFLLSPSSSFAAPTPQTAHARLYCLSIRFSQGTSGFGSTLDLTTLEHPALPNGELAPVAGDYSHAAGFILDFVGFPEPLPGGLAVEIPRNLDANQNGYADFFEVSQNLPRTITSGVFQAAGNESGTITAAWTRPQGSHTGTCTLSIVSSSFGSLGEFQHSFELIEYTGPLAYTPQIEEISGHLNLTRTGNPTETLTGPFHFEKSPHNPHDELLLTAGSWTNALDEPYLYFTDLFTRYETNYFGFVEFLDGYKPTPQEDYWLWGLSIDDPNDTNTNGIPDFSDTPEPPAQTLSLSVSFANNSLLLTVTGPVGHTVQLHESSSLPATFWNTKLSITLTNNPQIIPLPLPTNNHTFWRTALP